jgi:uncharacterized protein (DUF433 family)
MDLLSNGQWAIAPVIEQIANRIDFHEITELAERWYPMGRDEHVIIDPRISFGSPCLVNRGIKTVNIYDLFVAEQESLDSVCLWMKISKEEANSAIQFERNLQAA